MTLEALRKDMVAAMKAKDKTTKDAVSSPLLETSIDGATDAIINITGGVNLTLFEAEQAAEVVRAASGNDINTIFGAVINENLTDEVIVTVIATGFDKRARQLAKEKESVKIPTPSDVEKEAPRRRSGETTYTSTDDSSSDDGFELPPFLQNRNF